MGFYDSEENVNQYIQMCEGYDGKHLHNILGNYLSDGSSLLELGSGAGLDINHFKTKYRVTGSDLSEAFLKACQQQHPEIPLLKLDITSLNLSKQYDCIFSNKVLHHITPDALRASLKQQASSLSSDGIIAHSFWLGEKSEEKYGLLFTYYQQDALTTILSEHFEILSLTTYDEFEKDDSAFIVAKVKSN